MGVLDLPYLSKAANDARYVVKSDVFINVKDVTYGAKGDGTTDDTAAIQAALNAVPTNGGVVYFPPGAYKITATLHPTVSGTSLMGAGWDARILYDGMVATTAIGMGDTTQRRVNVRWLRISQSNATSSGTCIDASYFADGAIEHVLIDGSGTGAPPIIGVSYNSNATFYNVISDCRISVAGTNSIGIKYDSLANSNVARNVHIIADVSDASSIGIYVNAHSIHLDHVDIENCAGTGISVGTAGHGATVLGSYLENNGTNVALASGVNGFTMIGGTCENSSGSNVLPIITDNGALNPIFMNLRTSISGDKYAYTKGKFSDTRQPEDAGLIAWNWDPGMASNNTQVTGGTLYLARVVLRYATTITNLSIIVNTAATTATANQNFLLLYDSGGTLRGQTAAGAIDTATQSSGYLKQAMASTYVAPPGMYWVGAYFNASTQLKLTRGSGDGGTAWNVGLSGSNMWWAANGTGLTTTPPSSITTSSNTNTGAIPFWAALS